VVDPETAEAETNGSGVQPEDASAQAPTTTSQPAAGQVEADGGSGQQSTAPATAATSAQAGNEVESSGFDLGAWLKANWVPALLVVLLALTVWAVIYGLRADNDDALGKVCNGAAVPLLSIAIGYYGNRFFHGLSEKENLRRDVQMATYTTLHLRHSVEYVDERLDFAVGHLLSGSAYDALLHLVSAKTATELAFGMAQQSARQFELISAAGATEATDIFTADTLNARPKIKLGDNPKTVATSGTTTTAGGDDKVE
jgi:hypothetical protein